MSRVWLLWLIALFLLVTGCHDDDTNVTEELQVNRAGFVAKFSPADGIIPFPTNLLYSGTTDATLNIPVEDAEDFSDPQVALNALDGFSTIAPISTRFDDAVDSSTIHGATVLMFEVTLDTLGGTRPVGGPVNGVVGPLTYGQDYVASLSSLDPNNTTLIISPLRPLNPSSHYMVALTNGIHNTAGLQAGAESVYQILKSTNPLVDGSGASLARTLTDEEAQALEPLRQLTNAQEAALAGQSVDRSSVILSWVFSTQSTTEVLSAAKTAATGTSSINPTSIGSTATFLGIDEADSRANVYAGTLTVPYYLSNADASPADPLEKFWQGAAGSNLTRFNPTPVSTSTETIPLLVTVPKVGAAPWPVVIYQHGITSDRTTVLAVADALASAGMATVAIDMPLHGVAPSSPFYTGIERTFDLDLVNNETGAPLDFAGGETPDGADASGTHFINLRSLLTSRDNLRQAVADLFALHTALATMDYDGGGADFDVSNVRFMGQSLGSMVGGVFLALEPDVQAAVLAVPGGGIAKLLDGSARFGPRIESGLAANGVLKGSSEYEQFLGAAQTVMDAGDPLNFATDTVNGRGVLVLEVVGSDTSPADQVIPNNVFQDAPAGTVPAPLSGTDPLVDAMGLSTVSEDTTGEDLAVVMRFTAGHHGSALTPNDSNGEEDATSAFVFTVMQTAFASFLGSNGAAITVSDDSVLE